MHILSSTVSNLNDQADYFLSIWTSFLYSVGVILYSEQKADVNLFGLIYPIFAAISATDNCPSLKQFLRNLQTIGTAIGIDWNTIHFLKTFFHCSRRYLKSLC